MYNLLRSGSGNFGLAANKFSFGDEGLARALICFAFGTIWTYTTGIMISSMGRYSPVQAFGKLLAVPATNALIAAALIRYTGWQIPLFVDRSISLLGEAAIPLMMVILGLQIAEVRSIPWSRLKLISLAGLLQKVITPILALLSAEMLGLSGPVRHACRRSNYDTGFGIRPQRGPGDGYRGIHNIGEPVYADSPYSLSASNTVTLTMAYN
jgi:predicted permease